MRLTVPRTTALRDGSGQSNLGKVLSLIPRKLFILAVEYGIAAFSRHKNPSGQSNPAGGGFDGISHRIGIFVPLLRSIHSTEN
ncbi:unnamed protein product [Cyprideis torosa]|uniref:Uncharacterized protein n=1 Tax=Cyprideis torosa TaxID=163714 RepID=A0A7R8WZN9_9CRUS|nr:unnamed protein product [Cyprideis torosa]CAG0909373.1 unnamed protein product [Cyprideis torosa]